MLEDSGCAAGAGARAGRSRRGAAVASGGDETAATRERRAIELAERVRRHRLAERAHGRASRRTGTPRPAELTGRSALTAAEWRVCRQAAEGQTNREVAQALFVTEKTVERHLSSAYHKLGIRSRFQLAAAIGE